MKKVIFVNSHPIQYFAPLYAYCNEHNLDVEAWYCSDESVRGAVDVEFGQTVKWDIPLLNGYPYRFFKNYSWKPSINTGFWGLINWGMVKALRKLPKSIIVVHGWSSFTSILVLLTAKLLGHTVCLRGESPLNQEMKKSRFKLILRKMIMGHGLFLLVDRFLYIGSQNKAFYEYYGVSNRKLLFIPYAVDNSRFRKDADLLLPARLQLREGIHIPAGNFVFLFCGKYISKKRPMDIIRAFQIAAIPDCSLIMLGEGALRPEMENFITAHHLQENVKLTGFINQGMISEYYSISDAFVICSEEGETWGLVVNEAMNFGLPVIASNITGSSSDLVEVGQNGYRFKEGNVDELASCLIKMAASTDLVTMRSHSRKLVEKYSYEVIVDNIKSLQN